jgi:lysozyme
VQTSRNGKLFIARREGLVLVAYPDGPHHSIGFGHNDPDLKPGDKITVKWAFNILADDLEAREKTLNKILRVPVTQAQFDALMSLMYQSGNRYIHDVVKLINAGDFVAAANLLPECDRNLAGEKLGGLRKRRDLEQKLFQTGDYGELNPIPFWEGNPRTTPRGEYHVTEDDL